MQLDPEEEARRSARALEIVIKDYHDDFMDICATTIALTEHQPEQANNEVRNAFNHLARALTTPNLEQVDREISLARGHLERGKRDCLKLSIIHKHRQLDGMVFLIENAEGALPGLLKRRVSSLEKARKNVLRDEAAGKEDVAVALEQLLIECLDIEEELLRLYNVRGRIFPRWRRFVIRSWGMTKTAAFAILCSVIAAYVFLAFNPPGSDAADWVRQYIQFAVAPLKAAPAAQ